MTGGASGKKRYPRSSAGNKTDLYGVAMILLLCFFILFFASNSGAFENPDSQYLLPRADPNEGFESLFDEIPRSKSATDSIVLSLEEVQNVRRAQADFRSMVSGMEAYISQHELGAELQVDYNAYQVRLRFPDSIFFTFDQAELLKVSYPVLNHLLTIFEDNSAYIDGVSVEAHTDDSPIITSGFEDNRALSAERALEVVRYFLQSRRVDGAALTAIGHGESRPVGPNDTSAGRRDNRRLEFVIDARTASIDFWRNTGQ